MWGRSQLPHSTTLRAAGVPPSATLRLAGRLRGGAAVTVRPRVQRERWSLYWKESMATQTQMVDEVRLEVDPAATTGAQLLALVAERLRWPPVAELMALEGFDGPWERLLLQGRELDLEKLLAEQGVGSGAELTSIRIALAAEGWKVRMGGNGRRGKTSCCVFVRVLVETSCSDRSRSLRRSKRTRTA